MLFLTCFPGTFYSYDSIALHSSTSQPYKVQLSSSRCHLEILLADIWAFLNKHSLTIILTFFTEVTHFHQMSCKLFLNTKQSNCCKIPTPGTVCLTIPLCIKLFCSIIKVFQRFKLNRFWFIVQCLVNFIPHYHSEMFTYFATRLIQWRPNLAQFEI